MTCNNSQLDIFLCHYS